MQRAPTPQRFNPPVLKRTVFLVAGLLFAASASAATPPIPIPSVGSAPFSYQGAAATANPITGVASVPQNPFMAPNGLSEIHDNGWQTDSSTWGGPLGRAPHTVSSYLVRDCGSITFDNQGRVISICIGLTGPELYMFDPTTLATLATFALPPRSAEDLLLNPGLKVFQDFSNGGYFYLDNHDDAVTGTTNGRIYVIREDGAAPGFTLVRDYPLGLRVNEEITSQLPDSHGLEWFTARQDGVVGTLNLQTGAVHLIRLGQGADGEITKSLAVDAAGGVYIPTNHKLYRFTAGARGVPKISWQVHYPNDGVAKPGQLDAGTGTTPVISGPYVAINDNADPMDVVVYRRAAKLRRHERRMVCRVPVFARGQSADENALIAAGRSFVIENNYGYSSPASLIGRTTVPGFARVDVKRNGKGCRLVWTNTMDSAPTVVSKVALASGLIYTYTTDVSGNWYWTALDFRTGRTVYKALAGSGPFYNNNYAGISISPGGTEYLGTLGGIVAMRDGS
jgi:hypothetical protein